MHRAVNDDDYTYLPKSQKSRSGPCWVFVFAGILSNGVAIIPDDLQSSIQTYRDLSAASRNGVPEAEEHEGDAVRWVGLMTWRNSSDQCRNSTCHLSVMWRENPF